MSLPFSAHVRRLLVLTGWGLLLASQGASAEGPDSEGIEFYETHVRPLLARHCYACHSERAQEQEGALLLDTPAGWLAGGDQGASVVPGDPDHSLLIEAVRYQNAGLQMPPSGALPADDIARLEHWVRLGAPAPSGRDAAMDIAPSDPVAGKQHWAFRPLSQVRPPEVQRRDWPREGVDHFVLSQLESRGLQPVAAAEPRVLVRRLYVQLTGLPPTPDQVAAYLADTQPEATQRLVDQLLASPAFGERWGRHWLDLARYADSNGLDENFLFREAWRYRNWVIQASNSDMPYDRFVLEQIAGDLLPYESLAQRDRQRIAAGFLVLGPKVLLGNEEQNQRMEIADEQIETMGRAILGQTLGCARCHDHKFDPIPTADYYALAGIFASTQVMEMRYMLGQQRVMERLVGIGEAGGEADEAYEVYWRTRPQLVERQTQAEAILAELKAANESKLAELIAKHPQAVSPAAQDSTQPIESRVAAQEAWLADVKQQVASPPPIPPRGMIPADVEQPANEAIRLAGQFNDPGEVVPRGVLTVLRDQKPLEIADDQSGRIALADWLTDAEGRSGQLAARVAVNRLWHHLMGRGLVRTVDNFGRTGETPSHPELLDYLAQRLIDSDWSLKAVIREIVLSRSFGLSTAFAAENAAVDPDNQWLWRAHRRRLDPEVLRDGLLAAAGQLDRQPMESSVWYLSDQATAVGANEVRRRTDFPARSVYLPVIRNDLPELFQVFDFANPHATTGARPNTLVPTQGLYLLNDDMVMDAAQATAQRVLAASSSGNLTERIDVMYALILNAPAPPAERQLLEQFLSPNSPNVTQTLEAQAASNSATGQAETELQKWTQACHALFASSRFQFLD